MSMQNLVLRPAEQPTPECAIALLLVDDDAGMRSLVSASVRAATGRDGNDLEILEAEDGAEAIHLGLQQRPQLALLDINMPRVGGIDAAVVLRALLPQLRLALYSGDAETHRERAQDLGLPLFDKSDLDRATQWVSMQAAVSFGRSPRRQQPQRFSLVCAGCGYGICRSDPPDRCPMCRSGDGWLRKSPHPIAELT
jgi:CheY-like chemotaxis protein